MSVGRSRFAQSSRSADSSVSWRTARGRSLSVSSAQSKEKSAKRRGRPTRSRRPRRRKTAS